MATLKAKRAPIRAAFTRTWNELKSETSKPEIDQLLIKRLKAKLNDRFSLLEKVDEEIQSDLLGKDTTEEEFTEEFNSVLEYRDKFGDLNFVVEELLIEKDRCYNNSVRETIDARGTPTQETRSQYKLPKLELQKFSGDPIEWLGWWSQFKGIDEDKALSAEHKFQYLIQATVVKSPAHDLVTSFPATKENYPKAIKSLKSRFGKEKLLVQVYMRELLKLVLLNSNNKKIPISTLYDKLQAQLRGLESLGLTHNSYATMLYPLVESALPDETLKAWQRFRTQTYNENEEEYGGNELSSLLIFIKSEVDSEIRLKMARNGPSERVHNSSEFNTAMVSSSPTINKNNFCHFCKKSGHLKPYCFQFKKFLEKQEQKENDKEKQNDRDKKESGAANFVQLNDENDDEDNYALSIGNLRENELILDSGGTRHAFHDKKFFNTLDESYRNKIKMANGQYMMVFGIGSVTVKLRNRNGKVRTLTVQNVLYVPSLIGSVLSVSKLTDRNYEIEFNKSIGKLKYNNVIIGVADKTANGLYVMRQY